MYSFRNKNGDVRFKAILGKDKLVTKNFVPGIFDSTIEAAKAHDEFIYRNKNEYFGFNFETTYNFNHNYDLINSKLVFSDDNENICRRHRQLEIFKSFKKNLDCLNGCTNVESGSTEERKPSCDDELLDLHPNLSSDALQVLCSYYRNLNSSAIQTIKIVDILDDSHLVDSND